MSATVARAKRLGMRLGWHHPFFLPPLANVADQIVESTEAETARVFSNGLIEINPDYFKTLTDDQGSGLLAHELCHPMLQHQARIGNRDHHRWNCACDRAINQGLRESGITLPPGALFPPRGRETWTAEELYETEDQDDQKSPEGEKATGGCGTEKAEGGEGESTDRKWSQVAAQARALGRGTGSDKALARILDLPVCRVRYEQILRKAASQAVNEHGQDDVTFNRRGRRSPVTGPQFPGGLAYKASVAVLVDASGSVSDDDLTVAVANTIKIARALKLKIYFVAHDTQVFWSGWVDKATGSAIKGHIGGRGGTDFLAAYAAVASVRGRFDAMVHLTDGECNFPPKPRNVKKSIVALLGSKVRNYLPQGATVIDATL